MSVESKIRELMGGKLHEASFPGAGKNMEVSSPAQGSSQTPSVELMHKGFSGQKATSTASKSLMASGGAMEKSPMKQGSSQDAQIDSQDDQETQGKTQAKKAKKMPVPQHKGAGQAPNYTNAADPASVINQPSSKGNVYHEDVDMEDEDDYLTEEELDEMLSNLSEEELEELMDLLNEEEGDDDEDEDEDEYITEEDLDEVLGDLTEEELDELIDELSDEDDGEEDEDEYITEEEFEALSDEEQAMFEPVEFDDAEDVEFDDEIAMDDIELTDEEIESLLSELSDEELENLLLDEAKDSGAGRVAAEGEPYKKKSFYNPTRKFDARSGAAKRGKQRYITRDPQTGKVAISAGVARTAKRDRSEIRAKKDEVSDYRARRDSGQGSRTVKIGKKSYAHDPARESVKDFRKRVIGHAEKLRASAAKRSEAKRAEREKVSKMSDTDRARYKDDQRTQRALKAVKKQVDKERAANSKKGKKRQARNAAMRRATLKTNKMNEGVDMVELVRAMLSEGPVKSLNKQKKKLVTMMQGAMTRDKNSSDAVGYSNIVRGLLKAGRHHQKHGSPRDLVKKRAYSEGVDLTEGPVKAANKAKKNAYARELGKKVNLGRASTFRRAGDEVYTASALRKLKDPRGLLKTGRRLQKTGDSHYSEMVKKRAYSESFDLTNEIRSLFEGSDMSEEFMQKAASLFEAVVTAKVALIAEDLEQQTTELVEQIEQEASEMAAEFIENYLEEMVDHVDGYMNYVSEQWLNDNAVAVESALRSEITEDFMAGLKALFQENYIEVPEQKYDLVAEMEEKIEELTNTANESINENVELRQALVETKKDNIVLAHAFDLTMSDTEKLRSLVEDVEFEDEDMFSEKVQVIKKNFFSAQPVDESTNFSSDEEPTPLMEENNAVVETYAKLLSRGTSV